MHQHNIVSRWQVSTNGFTLAEAGDICGCHISAKGIFQLERQVGLVAISDRCAHWYATIGYVRHRKLVRIHIALWVDELESAYHEQATGLLEGGADLLFVETIFDSLNGKAALAAIERTFEEAGRRVPVVASVTITDLSGRNLS